MKILEFLLFYLSIRQYPSQSFLPDIELFAYYSFSLDIAEARAYGLLILKKLLTLNASPSFNFIFHNLNILDNNFVASIFFQIISPKPDSTVPVSGTISFESACCCHSNIVWLIYLSNILNVLIEENFDIIQRLNIFLAKDILLRPCSTALYLIYCDSFVNPSYDQELFQQNDQIKNDKKNNQRVSSDSIEIDFDNDSESHVYRGVYHFLSQLFAMLDDPVSIPNT